MQHTPIDTQWDAPGQGDGPVQVTLVVYAARDRLRAAALVFGACVLAAAGGALIPVFHFFLVPALLLLGVGLAVWRLRMRHAALRADGACPACGETVGVDLGKARPRPLLWAMCPACQERLRIALPATAVEP